MTEFLTFDTFEEMQEHLASLEQAANDRTTDDQKSMEPPCWWINPQPGIGLIIFGESWTLDEVDRRNRESYGHPLDPEEEEEADWSHRSMTDSYGRGYLFGKAFSLACPDGELGSTHRSEMIEISREQFEHARSHGWELWDGYMGGWEHD